MIFIKFYKPNCDTIGIFHDCEACSLKNLVPGGTREPGEVFRLFRPELPGSAPGSAARRTGEDPHELVANWPIEIDGDRTENSMVDLDKWRIVT